MQDALELRTQLSEIQRVDYKYLSLMFRYSEFSKMKNST